MEKDKTSFLLKDIKKDWWKTVKIMALKYDLTLHDFVIDCINLEIGSKRKPIKTPDDKESK